MPKKCETGPASSSFNIDKVFAEAQEGAKKFSAILESPTQDQLWGTSGRLSNKRKEKSESPLEERNEELEGMAGGRGGVLEQPLDSPTTSLDMQVELADNQLVWALFGDYLYPAVVVSNWHSPDRLPPEQDELCILWSGDGRISNMKGEGLLDFCGAFFDGVS